LGSSAADGRTLRRSHRKKGHQGTVREDVEVFAAKQKATGFKDPGMNGRWRSRLHRNQNLHRDP
jgi:hypothetical protein